MIPEITMSPELIVIIAGAVISLLFTYVPFKIKGKAFNVWFAEFSNEQKQFIMLVIMVLVTGVVFLLGCTDLLPLSGFTCDRYTGAYYVYCLLMAIVSNQGTDRVFPKPVSVRQARDVIKEDELYKIK